MRTELEARDGDALQAALRGATEALQARFGQAGPITGASQALVVAAVRQTLPGSGGIT